VKPSETIFDGARHLIPMARVMFVEKNGPEICVVLQGAQHPTDAQGQIINGMGRADCPYLSGEEAKSFLSAWCYYRAEVDGMLQGAELDQELEQEVSKA